MIKFIIGIAATLGATSAVSAASVSFAPGSGALGAGELLIADFNASANDGLVTGANFMFLTESSNVGALPAAGDGSRYLSVLAGGAATIAFASALTGFSVDIGSVDSYNNIVLNFAGGGSQSFTGSMLVANPDGNQSLDRTNGRFSFFAGGSEQFQSVTFRSTGDSFELDNLAAAVVPEPGTWGLMIAGFGLVGFAVRRRRAAGRRVTA